MSTLVKVDVDTTSLIASIYYENLEPKVHNDLLLIFSEPSLSADYSDTSCTIPWYNFKRILVPVVKILKRGNVNIQFDDFATDLLKDFISDRKNLKSTIPVYDIEKTEINELLKNIHFNRELKDEQLRDVSKLLKLKHGANFSVPGAGKTTTILAVHTILKHLGFVSKLFVISPINAFISWEDEIKEIFTASSLKVLRLTSNNIDHFSEVIRENPDVILVNYEKMRKDIKYLIPYFSAYKVHVILDESHRIKNGSSNLSFQQIKRLSDISQRRDILSGTPMPQSYLDLQPQLDFLWPSENIIPDLSKINEESRIFEINKAIEPLYVRTTKNELNLKDPNINYVKIPMGPVQSELYRLFKSETARVLAGMDTYDRYNFRKIGKSVIRLLQASTNPMLVSGSSDYLEDILAIPEDIRIWQLLEEFTKYEKPQKIEYLRIRIKTITEEKKENKIVIWSCFVKNIQLLERLFKDYNPVSIYGGVPTGSEDDENSREARIRKFHEDESCRLMIANPQACGEGISLHKVCHYAIYLDRNFNAAHYLQSIDRIHRLGLDPSIETNVEILVTENSIDEVLITRLNEKIDTMGKILKDKYLEKLAYDPADITLIEEDGIDNKDLEEIQKHILLNE